MVLNCPSFNPQNCSAPNQIVQANPDIAGIGVVVSFLATTCFAFILAFTVMFLDRYDEFLRLSRKVFRKNKAESPALDTIGPYWRSPDFWSRVLSKNLLAFSDTQLVTGLAVQFTAMLQHCQLSIYHFQVVTELAFLTTVTHLLALVALRDYFVKHKWINLPRVFFMLANLALLGYTSYVAYSYEIAGLNASASLACFFHGHKPPFTAAFGGRWATLLIGAIGGHVTIILAMYVLHSKPDEQSPMKWWLAALRTWVLAPVYACYGLVMAGIALHKTQALGTASVNIDGSEKQWSFGQFLPVLLLALPLFAGWESFWEEKDEDRENRFGRSRHSKMHNQSISNIHEHELTSFLKTSKNQSSPDTSILEARIESSGTTPAQTPQQRPSPATRSSSGLTPRETPQTTPNLDPYPGPWTPRTRR